MLSLNPFKKNATNSPKRSYRPKTFAHSNKSHFSIDIFFRVSFLQVFQRIRNQHQILRSFDTHIALFTNFKGKREENGFKKRKLF
jgi:hypothetical protein